MRTPLLLASLTLMACATTAPPRPRPSPPPSPPPVPSLEELEQTFLPRIEDNRRTVDSFEARKDEIVARKLEDLARLRELQGVRGAEIESKRQKIALLEEQLGGRRAQLAELAGGDEALGSDLEGKVAELEAEIARESQDLDARLAELAATDAEIERLGGADRDALFLDEMQPLYNEGIELHLGFYRGVIAAAREQLAPGEEASTLIDHFTARVAERDRMLGGELRPEAFATLHREFELDRRMSQAWLSALILEVRFSLNEYRIETVSEEEREELALLAESLKESWDLNPTLVMYIDGHADSKQFRGQSPCVSATKNRELSRLRAEAVRDFFAEKLGGEAERINVDWFGNFSSLTAERYDDLENRRIELRVASRRADGSFDSHRGFFALLRRFELGGRAFVRAVGSWVEKPCENRTIDAEIEYLSDAYLELAQRLGEAGLSRHLEVDGRELEIRLGNGFIIDDGGRCVAVRPCPDPAP